MNTTFDMSGFDAAARRILSFLSRDQIEKVADWISGDASAAAILDEVTIPTYRAAISQVIGAASLGPAIARAAAATHLRALGEGYALGRSSQQVKLVWSGPTSSTFQSEAIGIVVAEIVAEARDELTLMIGSPDLHPALADLLRSAIARGVTVAALIGPSQEGSKSSSDIGLAAAIPGIEVWRSVPTVGNSEQSSMICANLIAVDKQVLLITSANLIEDRFIKNIDFGLLVRGGSAPASVMMRLQELQASAAFERVR
jgi:hypothetical protein